MDKPLNNRKIVITRNREQAVGLITALETLGAECILFPTIRISPVADWTKCDKALQKINDYQWIVFSSANGVRYFLERAREIKKENFNNKIAVVGNKTKRELEDLGFKVSLIPDSYSATGLIESFKDENINGARILIPTSEIARDELLVGLQNLGAVVDQIAVYRNDCCLDQSSDLILNAFEQNTIDAVLFFSSSAVECFVKILGPEVCRKFNNSKAVIAAIGETTAASAQSAGFKVKIIPEKSLQESMLQAVVDYFRD